MIRLTDPTRIGPALASVRDMLGITRREAARQIGKVTGRDPTSVNAQMWEWDAGRREPSISSLGLLLDVIDCDLALAPRSEDPKRQLTLLAAIDNALRNGSHMTGANLAMEYLCEELGVDRDALTFDPAWGTHQAGSATTEHEKIEEKP